MGLQIDGRAVGEARYARPDGTLATVGEARVWDDGRWKAVYKAMDKVVLEDGTGNRMRDQMRDIIASYGLDYRTVTELPFRLDTSQVTHMQTMFYGCVALTTVPSMDTSNVTNTYSMFGGCPALTSVPDMDTSNVTDARYMFSGCSSLTDGNVRLIGKHPSVLTGYMLNNSGLTREPFYDQNGNPI